MNVDFIIPRQCGRQKHRINSGTRSVSLNSRFCETSSEQFNLAFLHPSKLCKLNRQQFKAKVSFINQVECYTYILL